MKYLVLIAMLLMSVPAYAQETQNPFCMGGICLGDLLSDVQVTWEAANPENLASEKDRARYREGYFRTYALGILGLTEAEFNKYVYPYITGFSTVLTESNMSFFRETKRICSGSFSLSGTFKADSGHKTTVTFGPKPVGSKFNKIIVTGLNRSFPFSTKADSDKILKRAANKYGAAVFSGNLIDNGTIPVIVIDNKVAEVIVYGKRFYGRDQRVYVSIWLSKGSVYGDVEKVSTCVSSTIDDVSFD